LRERLGLHDNLGATAKQVAIVWACVAKRKERLEYEVEGARPRGRPKKTWREIMEKDCQARKLNREEDAMDRNRWKKQIRDG